MDTPTLVEILIMVVTAFLGVAVVILMAKSSKYPLRLLNKEDYTPKDMDQVLSARKEALDRSSHCENIMISVGLLQFGILTFVGAKVLFIESTDAIQQVFDVISPNAFFAVTIILFSAVTMAYLHINKIYLGYCIYIVQLEILGLKKGLRPTSDVFTLVEKPNVPKFIRPIVSAVSGFQIVSLFPMVCLITAIIGIGLIVKLSFYLIICYSLFVVFFTVIYTAPPMIEFVRLVKRAQNIKGSSI